MNITRRNARDFLLIAFGVSIAFFVNSQVEAISPLFLSLLFGLFLSNTVGWQENRVAQFSSKQLLRFGVILLGFQISFDQFKEVGWDGLAIVILIVILVFFGVRFLSTRSGLKDSLPTFVAAGFAICGATAIAAISSTLLRGKVGEERKSVERDLSYAVGVVALCGTLSILVLPLVSNLLGLTDARAGAWIGAAVHDVGQVVATASLVGDQALEPAILVKLTRVVMLIPLVILVLQISAKQSGSKPSSLATIRSSFPTFVLLFLAVAVVVNLLSLDSSVIDVGKEASKVFLAFGLFGMGLGVKWKSISSLGARPVLVGVGLWILSASFSLALISLVF
ncbi:MAG: YeiH family protein [Candidatus Nanopelagicaceae bacterium]